MSHSQANRYRLAHTREVTVIDPAKAALEILDAARRRTGRRLDEAGYGPRTTPSTAIDVAPGVRLHTYPAADGDGPPVLLVPAPIKRSYLWDLEPDASVVGRAIGHGLRPFLVEWTEQPDDADLGLAHYADTLLGACLDTVTARTGSPTAAVAGHSLGGTLAAILAARRPERVAALVLLEAPLRFGAAAGSFARLVAATPAATLETVARGGVPGAFLDQVSALAAPREFTLERRLDLLRSISGSAASPTPGRCARTCACCAGRATSSACPARCSATSSSGSTATTPSPAGPGDRRRAGRARHAARTVDDVFAPRSAVIPPSSVVPVHEAAASPDKLLLEYGGDVGVALQHVGVLVGRTAPRPVAAHPGSAEPVNSPSSDLHEAHDLAIRLAREAGALQVRERAGITRTPSGHANDLVCTSTSRARRLIVDGLRGAFLDHGVRARRAAECPAPAVGAGSWAPRRHPDLPVGVRALVGLHRAAGRAWRRRPRARGGARAGGRRDVQRDLRRGGVPRWRSVTASDRTELDKALAGLSSTRSRDEAADGDVIAALLPRSATSPPSRGAGPRLPAGRLYCAVLAGTKLWDVAAGLLLAARPASCSAASKAAPPLR